MPTPSRYLRRGDLRSQGVMERRNGPHGLRNDYDDDDEGCKTIGLSKMESNVNFSRHLQAVRNRDC